MGVPHHLRQACKHVSVYGFSLDDSRRTNDMKAEGLRYHYFKVRGYTFHALRVVLIDIQELTFLFRNMRILRDF